MILADIRNHIVGKFFTYAPKKLREPLQAYINRRLVLVPAEQLDQKFFEAIDYLQKNEALGDYLEFGVFRGMSMMCMYNALKKHSITKTRLFGFDSFEGLPDITESQDKSLPWHPGQFSTPYAETRQLLDKEGIDWKRVFLIKGWYKDTLNNDLIVKYKLHKVSLIMIDCDLYSSTKQALDFCTPLIQDYAIIFFDDWGGGTNLVKDNLGEKKAFHEFLEANPQLKAKEFGSYHHTELKKTSIAKIFLVTKVR